MTRGVKLLVFVLIGIIVLGGGGGFYYVKFVMKSTKTVTAEEQLRNDLKTAVWYTVPQITTDLADQSMVQATVALAMKDAPSNQSAKDSGPLISAIILGQVRGASAAQLQGADGLSKLEQTLTAEFKKQLPETITDKLLLVKVMSLVVQQ